MSGKPEKSGYPKKPDEDQSIAGSIRKAGPFLHIGWSIAISVTAGAALGYWLDNKFDTSPFLLIFGSILGIAAAFVEIVRITKKLG